MSDSTRAQSELVGFLLIFSAVILAIVLVTATGFVGFHNAQDYQRTVNAEQAFIALANDVDDVVRGDAPSRSTEIGITDATLGLENDTPSIAISIDGTALDLAEGNELGSVVYDSGTETSITYQSGAIIRTDDGGSVLVRDPDFVITDEAVILPVVTVFGEDAGMVGGTTGVEITALTDGTDVVAEDKPVTDSVTIEVSTTHVDAWARYFEQFERNGPVTEVEPDIATERVRVEIETERVYVTVDRIDVSFR